MGKTDVTLSLNTIYTCMHAMLIIDTLICIYCHMHVGR